MYDLSTLRRAYPRKEIKQNNFFTFITQYNFRFKTLPKGPLNLILYKQKQQKRLLVTQCLVTFNSRQQQMRISHHINATSFQK